MNKLNISKLDNYRSKKTNFCEIICFFANFAICKNCKIFVTKIPI